MNASHTCTRTHTYIHAQREGENHERTMKQFTNHQTTLLDVQIDTRYDVYSTKLCVCRIECKSYPPPKKNRSIDENVRTNACVRWLMLPYTYGRVAAPESFEFDGWNRHPGPLTKTPGCCHSHKQKDRLCSLYHTCLAVQ